MKNKALWGFALVGLVLAGCIVPSVYPFYTEKDLEFDATLIGDWQKTGANADTKETWSFAKSAENEYEMQARDSDKTNVLTVHLFHLKNQLYMDWLLHPNNDVPSIPPHYLMKVGQIRPTLALSTLNIEYVTKLLTDNPRAIRHTFVYDNPGDTNTYHVVLTAETAELQKFVAKIAGNSNAWSPMDEMKPIAPGK